MRYRPAALLHLVAFAFASAIAFATMSTPLVAQPRALVPLAREICRAGTRRRPAEVLEHTVAKLGIDAAGDKVVHFKRGTATAIPDQSDRMYPPYVTMMRV